MLLETSKAQKTSIKKSKTCSWREWQNLSIFKKCIKNHSSSSENCYSTGRGSKVHTSGTHILWEVASCDNILTNMIYFSLTWDTVSGDARHSEEYCDNISGDCHHGAEAETRGGSAGNLHTTLPAAGICHFVTNHATSFVLLCFLRKLTYKMA